MLLVIYINNIPSLRDPESSVLTFDDRIEKIQLINGNTVQDYGHIASGDVISLTCVFSVANYNQIKNLWTSRTRVSFTDTSGEVWTNLRLVFRNIKREKRFPNYVTLTFELWRC